MPPFDYVDRQHDANIICAEMLGCWSAWNLKNASRWCWDFPCSPNFSLAFFQLSNPFLVKASSQFSLNIFKVFSTHEPTVEAKYFLLWHTKWYPVKRLIPFRKKRAILTTLDFPCYLWIVRVRFVWLSLFKDAAFSITPCHLAWRIVSCFFASIR